MDSPAPTTPETTPAELAGRLSAVLAGQWGSPPPIVAGPVRLSGGASRETWAFTAERDGTPVPLILRRDPPSEPRPHGMVLEAAALRAAYRRGVPEPELLAWSGERDQLEAAFLVMTFVDGETIARRILRDPGYAPARERFARQCGEILAGIHAIPTAEVPGLADLDTPRAVFDRYAAYGQLSPTFEWAFRWLEEHRPPPSPRRTVIHGDFRLGNLIVGPEGVRAVLDWENVHVGDPAEDLGWLTVRAWRFGAPGEVGGMGSIDELIAGYERAGGGPVDKAAVTWWQIFGTLRWGIVCIDQAARHLTGATRSVELAAIGRRVVEQEHDLLVLLDGPDQPAAPPPTVDVAEPGLHGRPTAAELVVAVREFLTGEVMPATTGSVNFHARVANNVLATVERELLAGPGAADGHAAALAGFGCADDTALAHAIRAGKLDDRTDEVVRLLRTTVAAKLAVANPRWAGGRADR